MLQHITEVLNDRQQVDRSRRNGDDQDQKDESPGGFRALPCDRLLEPVHDDAGKVAKLRLIPPVEVFAAGILTAFGPEVEAAIRSAVAAGTLEDGDIQPQDVAAAIAKAFPKTVRALPNRDRDPLHAPLEDIFWSYIHKNLPAIVTSTAMRTNPSWPMRRAIDPERARRVQEKVLPGLQEDLLKPFADPYYWCFEADCSSEETKRADREMDRAFTVWDELVKQLWGPESRTLIPLSCSLGGWLKTELTRELSGRNGRKSNTIPKALRETGRAGGVIPPGGIRVDRRQEQPGRQNGSSPRATAVLHGLQAKQCPRRGQDLLLADLLTVRVANRAARRDKRLAAELIQSLTAECPTLRQQELHLELAKNLLELLERHSGDSVLKATSRAIHASNAFGNGRSNSRPGKLANPTIPEGAVMNNHETRANLFAAHWNELHAHHRLMDKLQQIADREPNHRIFDTEEYHIKHPEVHDGLLACIIRESLTGKARDDVRLKPGNLKALMSRHQETLRAETVLIRAIEKISVPTNDHDPDPRCARVAQLYHLKKWKNSSIAQILLKESCDRGEPIQPGSARVIVTRELEKAWRRLARDGDLIQILKEIEDLSPAGPPGRDDDDEPTSAIDDRHDRRRDGRATVQSKDAASLAGQDRAEIETEGMVARLKLNGIDDPVGQSGDAIETDEVVAALAAMTLVREGRAAITDYPRETVAEWINQFGFEACLAILSLDVDLDDLDDDATELPGDVNGLGSVGKIKAAAQYGRRRADHDTSRPDSADHRPAGASPPSLAEIDPDERGILVRLIGGSGERSQWSERILTWYAQPDLRLLPLVAGGREIALGTVLPIPVSLVGARAVECTTKRATSGEVSRPQLLCLSDPNLISSQRRHDPDVLRCVSPRVVDGSVRIDGRALPQGRWILFALAQDGDPYGIEREDLFALKRSSHDKPSWSSNEGEGGGGDAMHLLTGGFLVESWAAHQQDAPRERLRALAFMIWTQCLLLLPAARAELAGSLDGQVGRTVLDQLESPLSKMLDAWRQELIEQWAEVRPEE